MEKCHLHPEMQDSMNKQLYCIILVVQFLLFALQEDGIIFVLFVNFFNITLPILDLIHYIALLIWTLTTQMPLCNISNESIRIM